MNSKPEPSDPAAPADRPETPQLTFADRVVERVAELPDRTSPEDWPEAMLVTADELRHIVTTQLVSAALPAPSGSPQVQEEKDDLSRVESGATIPPTGSTAQSSTGDK